MLKNYFIPLIMILLIINCKSSNSETQKKDTISIQPTVIDEDLLLKNLLKQVGGNVPKKQIKFFDAEIIDLKGNRVKISDYSGRLIFLNLWATWCPPCRAEMPSMDKLYEKYKSAQFAILAISQGEDLATVNGFLKKNPYQFPIFLDDQDNVAKNYATGSIPTSYLIGKDGYIIAQFVGAREWFSQEAQDLIEILLRKN